MTRPSSAAAGARKKSDGKVEAPGCEPDESGAARGREATSSLARMLQILDLITFERPAITLEEISREVGYTVSTSYRYVRELTAVG
ncbi:helix-turn-helix domain-containing protein, partial [Pantanalinema rosaneae CENA516]|uniref:helix-turn-helix domain-containing protein n=1 Tax=Pantanalinema rosaneae TaxID=1620701 RepID=UPI003D6E1635